MQRRDLASTSHVPIPVLGIVFTPDPLFTAAVVEGVGNALASAKRSGDNTAGCERIFELLRAAGVAWHAHVPIDCCGVHYDNRDGFGVDCADSQVHSCKILATGFS